VSNLLNCHLLINHAPSALNCDDTGTPKTARHGGVERLRISSQCTKRSGRFGELFHKEYGDPSLRTSSMEKLAEHILSHLCPEWNESYEEAVVDLVVKAGMQAKTTTAWMPAEIKAMLAAVDEVMKKHGKTAVDVAKLSLTTKSFMSKEKKAEEEPGKNTDTDETESSAEENTDEAATANGKGKGKGKGKNKDESPKSPFEKDLVKAVQEASAQIAAAGFSTMDVALFGRMCASGALREVEGAVAFSHAISTHEVILDTDYFTVADDLKYRGAGHINDKDFGSGTLYLYFSVNIGQLARNLRISKKAAMKKAAALPRIIAKTVPSGKQNSFASHPVASYIMVECLDTRMSLHEAFETPVQMAPGGGFAKPSVVALEDFWENMHRKMEHANHGNTAVLTIYEKESRLSKDFIGVNNRPVHKLDTLSGIDAWICNLAEKESDTVEVG